MAKLLLLISSIIHFSYSSSAHPIDETFLQGESTFRFVSQLYSYKKLLKVSFEKKVQEKADALYGKIDNQIMDEYEKIIYSDMNTEDRKAMPRQAKLELLDRKSKKINGIGIIEYHKTVENMESLHKKEKLIGAQSLYWNFYISNPQSKKTKFDLSIKSLLTITTSAIGFSIGHKFVCPWLIKKMYNTNFYNTCFPKGQRRLKFMVSVAGRFIPLIIGGILGWKFSEWGVNKFTNVYLEPSNI